MPDLNLLRQMVNQQLLAGIFVVLVLVVLYVRLHREEFFWWWGWAFGAHAATLFFSWLSLLLPTEWTPLRYAVVWAMTFSALGQIPLLIAGVQSLRTDKPPRKFNMKLALGLTFALATAMVIISRLPLDGVVQYAIRTVPRHALLALAYVYCGWIFLAKTQQTVSMGVRVTAFACLLYAGVRAMWTFQLIPGVPVWENSNLSLLNLASTLLIALGAVLFLLERHNLEHQRLTLYEQILPTCSLCGNVRDDTGKEHGKGDWVGLQDFVTKHSETQLSHTICPNCIDDYKKQQGL